MHCCYRMTQNRILDQRLGWTREQQWKEITADCLCACVLCVCVCTRACACSINQHINHLISSWHVINLLHLMQSADWEFGLLPRIPLQRAVTQAES